MKFGFVVHPLSPLTRALLGVRTLQPWIAAGIGGRPRRVARFEPLVSAAGAVTAGEVRAIPMSAPSMLADQARAVETIARAVEALASGGAGIVGLGSLCAVVGLRGEEVAARARVPVTTGVSFTAFAAARTLDRVASTLGERVDGASVALVGAPGALAEGVGQLLLARGARVTIAGGAGAKKAAEHLPGAVIAEEARGAVAGADFVVAASSTGRALDPSWLTPGAVVIDVAEPRDLPRSFRRDGVLVVDGENVSVPPRFADATGLFTRIYDWVIGQRAGTIYACFAEPIVLALEGRAERFSIGRAVLRERAEEIGRLGEKHGFAVDKLMHAGRTIDAGALARVQSLRRQRSPALVAKVVS